MNKDQAMDIVLLFRKVCKKNNLWMTTEYEEKPDLKMIRIKEISIKIDEVAVK